jgi:WD40 repeat protein
MFSLSNESNKLLKKFKVHKGAVRTVEFDKTGKYLISGSKDKSFKITDIVRFFKILVLAGRLSLFP